MICQHLCIEHPSGDLSHNKLLLRKFNTTPTFSSLSWVTIKIINKPVAPFTITRTNCFIQRCCLYLDCDLFILVLLPGYFIRGLDGYHVLCTRRSQFLGLDIFCFAYCGEYIITKQPNIYSVCQ